MSFHFFATGSAATFECTLGGAAYSACASPKAYSGLQDNLLHTFSVRAIDATGLADRTPASYTWAVGHPELYPPPHCEGSSIGILGGSDQALAQTGIWIPAFDTNGADNPPRCAPFGPSISYAQVSADTVVNEWGNRADNSYSLLAADIPPSPAQVSRMVTNNGGAAQQLHTIPVAQTAIAVIAHLPTGCTTRSTTRGGGRTGRRLFELAERERSGQSARQAATDPERDAGRELRRSYARDRRGRRPRRCRGGWLHTRARERLDVLGRGSERHGERRTALRGSGVRRRQLSAGPGEVHPDDIRERSDGRRPDDVILVLRHGLRPEPGKRATTTRSAG